MLIHSKPKLQDVLDYLHHDPSQLDQFIWKVYCHIFTSPTSAISGNPSTTKLSKAFLHSLTTVTSQTLAYAAVQAQFTISSVEAWSICNASFNYKIFYLNIIAVFEDKPENPWVQETLHWWNDQLPDLNKPTKKRK
ncbi:hypothetical protein H0H87_003686 [Tephrocybe sp. NHM501043]|nr:hypothetical protein H0H87_003686 [Tephrocybe sp. NHM501043]